MDSAKAIRIATRIAKADGGPIAAGPQFDPKDGLGAVQNNQNVNYLGMVRHMTADDFLRLASPLTAPREGHVEGIKKEIQKGRALGNPFLEAKWNEGTRQWDTMSHDGRHRSLAIKSLYGGDTPMPVHIFPREGMRSRHITDEMRAAPMVPQDEVRLRRRREEAEKHLAEAEDFLKESREKRRRERLGFADGGPVDAPPDRQLNPQGLYSAAAEAARALPQQKGTPQQMLASLKGVKPDELKWSGAQQAFAGQPTVTKDQLAQHFQNTLPPIQEEDGGGKFQRYSMTPNTYGGRGNLKGGYGTNYREKLLTLPDRVPDVPAFEDHPANAHFVAATNNARREAQDIWQMLPQGNRNENPNYRAAVERANLAHREERVAREQYSSNITKTLQEHRNFQSSHWDSPNVLAHLRMSDWQAPAPGAQQPRYPSPPKPDTTAGLRMTATPDETTNVPAWSTETPGLKVHREIKNGKPMTGGSNFTISHMPSGYSIRRNLPFHHAMDLANRIGSLAPWNDLDGPGVKAHFKNSPEAETRRREEWDRPAPPMEKVLPRTRKPSSLPEKNLLLDELQSDWGQKARNEGVGQRNLTPPNSVGVPDAPYIGKTEGWTDLGLKRALREAAQGGYHRLLWTPGEKQAKRYNLSNQVDHIQYNPVDRHFRAFKQGRDIVSKMLSDDNELSGLIGKEAAEKLVRAPKTPSGTYHELKGEDMDVGGGGMKGFYDNIVPKRLLALAREHDPEAKLEHFQDKRKSSPINGFPSLPITEKMRESIMKRGFKAYARGGHVAPPDSAKAIRKALRIAGSTA